MKQLKVLFALIAVVFVASSAFTSAHKFTQQVYSYTGSNPTLAASWTVAQEAPCPATDGQPCVIQVLSNGAHPNQSALDNLASLSNDFTHAYSNATEFVTVKD